MADDITVTPGTGATIAADDVGGKLHQRIKLSIGDDGSAQDAKSSSGQLNVSGVIAFPSANFTRPADTTAYAAGDLIANSTTAGSVVPMSFTAARYAGGSGFIRAAKLRKSTTTLTNAFFRLHLYAADPSAATGITNGDNGAWLTKFADYIGMIDIIVDRAFSDAAIGRGAPSVGSELAFVPVSGQTVYGLLEARAAYAPGNAEVFTVTLDVHQN
jgi:hypothetical protein